MAVKDVEIPYYRVVIGSKPALTFDFSDVIPTGMTIRSYAVYRNVDDLVEHLADASILSDKSVLVALDAQYPGETLLTVDAMIGTANPGTLKESLQARVLVEGATRR